MSRYLVLVVILFVSAGCSDGVDRPLVVPVTGTVMYKQKPVDGATVSFMAEGASRVASGVTDAEGKFELSTFGANDGAVVGEHVVTVSKLTAQAEAAGDPTANMNDPSKLTQAWEQSKDADLAASKTLLPEQYSNANSTPLKENVSETGENIFIFQLKD